MEESRSEGRRILVTGAASGIGRASALRLIEEGAHVVFADRDEAGLANAVDQAQVAARAHALVYDAADGDASAALVEHAAGAMGGLDGIVCNAGIYRRNHFSDISPDEWSVMFAINLSSVFRIVQAGLPHLKETGGSVVTIASTAAIHGIAYAAHYAAAKAGVVALTRSLAVEHGPSGIRFNVVCPGKVNTSIGAGLVPLDVQLESLLVRPPKLAGRTDGGRPEDIASAIAWLISDDAAYVSGSVLVVDGAQNVG